MRSEGAANRWSLNSRGGGSVTGVWEHAENSRHNPSTAEYLIWQIMRPAVSAVKQLLRIVVQHHGGRVRCAATSPSFPVDFMFQLTDAEFELLMSQFGDG